MTSKTETKGQHVAGLIEEHSAYALASFAGCSAPDNGESAGADLLNGVYHGVREAIEWAIDEEGIETPGELRDHMQDRTWEIADGAPSVYTGEVWAQFTDLGAYHFDPEDGGEAIAALFTGEDDGTRGNPMESAAAILLYEIARNLANVLTNEAIEAWEAEDDEAPDLLYR